MRLFKRIGEAESYTGAIIGYKNNFWHTTLSFNFIIGLLKVSWTADKKDPARWEWCWWYRYSSQVKPKRSPDKPEGIL